MPKRRMVNKKRRSKRYAELKSKVDATNVYTLDEAIALVKETSNVKFDASIELHARLGIDPKKGEQQIRSTVTLPHGSGKTISVLAIVEDDKVKEVKAAGAAKVGGIEVIDEINKSKKCDYDVVVTTPGMMKDIAKIAKILGPKGMMPNPKDETVTANPAKVIGELSKGKVSYKNDSTSNIHLAIGKVSFEDAQIKENINAVLDSLKKNKPASIKGVLIKSLGICSAMGPCIKFTG